MSAPMKKHLTKNEVSAVVSLLFKSIGIHVSHQTKESTTEKIVALLEEVIENRTLEKWDKDRRSIHFDPIQGPAAALKGGRLKVELTQKEVVEKIPGLNQPNLSAMEKGERSIPEHMIKQFAKLYKINPNLLRAI